MFATFAVAWLATVLASVAGRPAERITDLRRMERVVRAGRVYRTAELCGLVGVTPRW